MDLEPGEHVVLHSKFGFGLKLSQIAERDGGLEWMQGMLRWDKTTPKLRAALTAFVALPEIAQRMEGLGKPSRAKHAGKTLFSSWSEKCRAEAP